MISYSFVSKKKKKIHNFFLQANTKPKHQFKSHLRWWSAHKERFQSAKKEQKKKRPEKRNSKITEKSTLYGFCFGFIHFPFNDIGQESR